MFYGYVDFTDDGRPYYVGIGNLKRLKKLGGRNTKHEGTRKQYGQLREVWYKSNDWTACKWWEEYIIAVLETYHYDVPKGIGCNFTRGGDGTCGWKPSLETRMLWSEQRKGNTWGCGPRPVIRGRPKPWVTQTLKGRKRPDLSEIMQGKKRGKYDISDEMRWKQGATNRGKHLPEEHRRKIGEANKGREVNEETRQKLRKPKSLETRERMREAALKRWKKQHEDNH